ncbi:MAG: IS200/IS605 family transposase [Bacteroidales bacterium]|nr:IS200/IS605 family transposase [Bacteroidales bacterium]
MSHISIYYHIIWRTKYSQQTIDEVNERQLYAYIHGYCQNKKSVLYRVNGMPDHIHMLVSIHPSISVSTFMKVLKTETSKWMKYSGLFPEFQGWGNGYACFSYSFQEKQNVYNYILNQKNHHQSEEMMTEVRRLFVDNGLEPDTDLFFKDDVEEEEED